VTKIQTKAGVPTNKRDDEEAEQRSLSGALLHSHDGSEVADTDVELVVAEANTPCNAWNESTHQEEDAIELAQSAFAPFEAVRAVADSPKGRILRISPLCDRKRVTRRKMSVTDCKSDNNAR